MVTKNVNFYSLSPLWHAYQICSPIPKISTIYYCYLNKFNICGDFNRILYSDLTTQERNVLLQVFRFFFWRDAFAILFVFRKWTELLLCTVFRFILCFFFLLFLFCFKLTHLLCIRFCTQCMTYYHLLSLFGQDKHF